MRRLLVLALLFAGAASAAIYPVQPAPAGEVDLAVLVAAEGPGWVRVDDSLDVILPIPSWGRFFLVGIEDLPEEISDNDFNDVFGMYDSLLQVFTVIASYSGDAHTVEPFAGVLFLDSAGNCCNTGDFDSWTNTNRFATFGKPEAVPEPAALTLFAFGIAALFGLRRARVL